MKKYTAIATVEYYYEFTEEDMPKGYTPEAWAEDVWANGHAFLIDGHEMEVDEVEEIK